MQVNFLFTKLGRRMAGVSFKNGLATLNILYINARINGGLLYIYSGLRSL